MATTLITGGRFYVKDENHATPTYQNFSDAITSVQLLATADEIAIPQTLATPKTSRKGGVKYELAIEYLSNDTSLTAELYGVLWQAVSTGTGLVDFQIRFRDAGVSSSNPVWSGTFSVLSTQLGGKVADLSSSTGTYPLTGVPTYNLSEPV